MPKNAAGIAVGMGSKDVFTKAKRSAVMAAIRSRGNMATELRMVALFRAHGITGWRRQQRLSAAVERGKLRVERGNERAKRGQKNPQPSTLNSQLRRGVSVDFVFRKERVAVFVDGCFWHGCPRHGTMPAGNRAFWMAKLTRNAARDREVTRTLRKAGWRVLRVWECDLAKTALWPRVVRRLERTLGR